MTPEQTLIIYDNTPPRIPIVAPNDDDFLPPSFTEREQVVHISPG